MCAQLFIDIYICLIHILLLVFREEITVECVSTSADKNEAIVRYKHGSVAGREEKGLLLEQCRSWRLCCTVSLYIMSGKNQENSEL